MQGDKNAARESYQNFLMLWKDADPNISRLQANQNRVREAAIACVAFVLLLTGANRPLQKSDSGRSGGSGTRNAHVARNVA